jgi:folate-binding protein YgfZ
MLSPAPETFKANPPASALPALSTHAVLAVEGADASAFLQAQLMNDVRTLAVAHWQWTGWLNPKGRLVAMLALLRTSDNVFLLLAPDFPVVELQARLQRYVFRSKVRLHAAAGWTCAAQLDDAGPRGPRAELAEGSAEAGWRLDMGGNQASRALWVLPPGSALAGPVDAVATARWQALDLAHGLPRLPPEGVEAWTPQMLSLERLRAFSLSKGCYPGQEIVARTHYLGKAKRALARVEGQDLRAGESLRAADGREAGQVACARIDGREALAVVAAETADGPWLRAGGGPALRLPLEAGLARPV